MKEVDSIGYPNREVASSMALLYAKVLMKDSEFSPQLVDAFARGQLSTSWFFNSVFNAWIRSLPN